MNPQRRRFLGAIAAGAFAVPLLSSFRPADLSELPPIGRDPAAHELPVSGYEPFEHGVVRASYNAPILVVFGGGPQGQQWERDTPALMKALETDFTPYADKGWTLQYFNVDDGHKTAITDEWGRTGENWTYKIGVNTVPYAMVVYQGYARRIEHLAPENAKDFLRDAVAGLRNPAPPPVDPRLQMQKMYEAGFRGLNF